MAQQQPKEKSGHQTSSVIPAVNPENHNDDLLGQTCLQCSHGTDVIGVANYSLIEFRDVSTG